MQSDVSTPGVLNGSNDNEKLLDLCSRTYKEQAIWFLNAFWDTFAQNEAEKVWAFHATMVELDEAKKAQGNAVDEFQAHRFLEKHNEPLTVQAMRDRLRSSGAIGQNERPRNVPLTHVLSVKYKIDWRVLVNAPQGSGGEELLKAQRMLEDAQAACEQARAALHELQNQENAYNRKTEQLRNATEVGGMVSRNKAKAELAQHLAEDPLPLRRAKITAEAAVNKAQKSVREAEEYLERAKSMGLPQGAIWWMEKELQEAKKYLPKSKGGVNPRESH